MLNGIEFQTVGAAYLKALRLTAVKILTFTVTILDDTAVLNFYDNFVNC